MSANVATEDYGVCPQCRHPLKLVTTQRGMMLGCSNYPQCNYLTTYTQHGVVIEKVIEDCTCPLCGGQIAVKSGRFGMFIGCCNYPDCNYIYKEEPPKIFCPQCGGHLVARKTKYNKVFWGCDNYPQCSFHTSYQPIAKTCEECACKTFYRKKNKQGRYLQCAKCGKTAYTGA